MKKKQKILLFGITMMLLTGCAKAGDNSISRVEEIQTTTKVAAIDKSETQAVAAGDSINGVPKERVKDYLSDDHFYDESEGIDFTPDGLKHFHIKMSEAFASDDVSAFGEYFVGIADDIEEDIIWAEETLGYQKENMTLLCVPVEITNIAEKEQQFCVGNVRLTARIEDNRLVEYGLADKYVASVGMSTELWYDYPKKVDNGKSYYMVDMQPGESITTNLLYLIDKKTVDKDLYLSLYSAVDTPQMDRQLGCEAPSTNEDVKYIKVPVRKGEE